MIHKSLHCVVEAGNTNPHDRYVLLVLTIWQQCYILAGIYIPPPFKSEILYAILERVTPHCPVKLLLLGDFKTVFSLHLDRATPPKPFAGDLPGWALSSGFTEVWRWKHPSTRRLSWPPNSMDPIHLSFILICCRPLSKKSAPNRGHKTGPLSY